MTDLAEEAAFADAAYRKHEDDLLLNQRMFRKYAQPLRMWDWRQYGAKRLGSVRQCRLLDYGCGAGEEAVYFAKLGAQVTAIDISPVGVELATKRAAANGVRIDAQVMRCDPTNFPECSFDVVHGFGILHHLGLEVGLREAHRLLVPGGRGLFFEHMGNSQLIEWLRPKEHYTTGEQPVRWAEIQRVAAALFRKVETKPFHLIARLRNRIAICGSDTAKRIDHALLSVAPALRYFASGVVIYLEK